MRPSAPPLLFGREIGGIHCVGVGGMGVAPLAIYLAQSGYRVTGEDDSLPGPVRELLERERVILSSIPDDCDLVVFSSAIARGHATYAAAAARNLPFVRRGELLAELVAGRKLVAICGSHGKTTTTAMLVTALRRANVSAGYVLGGLFADDTPPARIGSSDWIVAEIDESDGTIDRFAPEITVTVNLDWDHPDYYRQASDLEATFAALFARTRRTVLVNDACALSQRLAGALGTDADAAPRVVSFGRSGDFAGSIAQEKGAHLTLALGGSFELPAATVQARGDFNAANATAALAAAQLMGVVLTPRLLADYPGVRRRQSLLSTAGGLTVLEDYAHHPAEIRALLASLRARLENAGEEEAGRLVVVFQPHRFSRTAQFKAEFAAALALADLVHLLDVYSAGEAPIAGGTTADIYADLKHGAPAVPVNYLPGDDAEFFRALSRDVRPGDLVVFVGAGDIDQKARGWLVLREWEALKDKRWDALALAVRPHLSSAAKLRREEPLAPKTTLRVGGAARLYAEPATLDDLRLLWRQARERELEVFWLGRGSNLIVPDEGVDGLVVSLAHPVWAEFEPRADGRVWVGAGLRLKNLCGLAGKAGLAGFEFLEGIPGSVGGALRMNAGAMGGWIFDVVDEVQLMTLDGEIRKLRKSEMHIDYRHCAELHDALALGALLRPASASDVETVRRQIDLHRRKRHESQPREPSAGCIFKNPPGHSAGRLIEESGLKGERVGDAEVSAVHANFIVNRGQATGADVLELVRRIRARVRQAKGVELEPEVLLYGKSWKDVL